jgi:hypothetical protein
VKIFTNEVNDMTSTEQHFAETMNQAPSASASKLADELDFMAERGGTFETTMVTRKLLLRAAAAIRQANIDSHSAMFAFNEKCEQFRIERDSLAKDAERYRALRNFGTFAHVDALLDTTEFNTVDSAIDHVMGLAAQTSS